MTRRVIGQNVWLAFGLSVVLLALAARGVLDPLKGVLAQSVAVPIVVANSARISRFSHRGPHVQSTGLPKNFAESDSHLASRDGETDGEVNQDSSSDHG